MGMMSSAFLLFLVLPLVSALNIGWGSCPTPTVQANFTFQRYMGTWYEIERLPNLMENGKCVEVDFTQKSDGNIRVTVSESVDGNKVQTMEGSVHQNIGEPAKLGLSYYYLFSPEPWWVLATDYDTVAAVYSCVDFFHAFHMECAWITGRSRTLSADVIEKAKMVFRHNNINIKEMVPADQDGCYDE